MLTDFVFLELNPGRDMWEMLKICCSFLLWLNLCGNLVRPWYPDVWSGMSGWCCEALFKMRLASLSVDFSIEALRDG